MVKLELSEPDALALFRMLSAAPHAFPDVLDALHVGMRPLYRMNEGAELAGEEPPYPELSHEHQWNADAYCDVCGADGAA